jgi:UDPglucose 6-dehydrogenase
VRKERRREPALRGESGRRARARSPGRGTQATARPVVGVVGLGYVGLATALAFARYGRAVVGTDISGPRREELRAGETSMYEPGLAKLLRETVRTDRFRVTDTVEELVASAELIFLCVPTPSREDGSVDLGFVLGATRALGEALRAAGGWRAVVLKSTAVPGTVVESVQPELIRTSGRTPGIDLGVAANPEFLAEGQLVHDALHPARVVLGVADRRTERALLRAYRGFPGVRVLLSPTGAELVKYASNALLATKVSFANEMARLAGTVGVDVYPVLDAVGLDPRLGGHFLRAGPGFGGSCFGKDLRALLAFGAARGVPLEIPRAALSANAAQARHVVDLAERAAGTLRERPVALLGLAFKPDTNDTRESQAYPILYELLRRGARVRLHDPVAMESFRRGLEPDVAADARHRLTWSGSVEDAVRGADLAILHDDWKEYRRAPMRGWRALGLRLVVDARRTLSPERLEREGVRYVAVGR